MWDYSKRHTGKYGTIFYFAAISQNIWEWKISNLVGVDVAISLWLEHLETKKTKSNDILQTWPYD